MAIKPPITASKTVAKINENTVNFLTRRNFLKGCRDIELSKLKENVLAAFLSCLALKFPYCGVT